MKKKHLYNIIITIFIIILVFFFVSDKKDSVSTIKYSAWGSQSETVVIKSAIEEFEKENPDIKVDFIHIPQNYFQKLHLLFASGLEPDVIFINNQNIKLYINAGLLENLSPYFENIEDTFYKEAINCFMQNDNLYAIPRDISNLVIYYNKDILKSEGVNLPEKISSIYELKDIAEKLTTKEHWGINFEENPLFIQYYIASNGGGVISDDGKEIIINKQESIDAINLYSDMINKLHVIPNKAQVGSMTSAQMFINKKLAMYLSGRWMVPKIRETANFDWDVIEFPANEKNKVYIDSSGWAISKNSKHKEAAIKFVKYLSYKNSIDKFAESGLIVPSRLDSAELLLYNDKNKKPKNDIAFINMLKYAKPTPVNKNYGSINDIMQEALQDVFSGTNSAEEIFSNETVSKLNKLLE